MWKTVLKAEKESKHMRKCAKVCYNLWKHEKVCISLECLLWAENQVCKTKSEWCLSKCHILILQYSLLLLHFFCALDVHLISPMLFAQMLVSFLATLTHMMCFCLVLFAKLNFFILCTKLNYRGVLKSLLS